MDGCEGIVACVEVHGVGLEGEGIWVGRLVGWGFHLRG